MASLPPLSSIRFRILLALSLRPAHGYAIHQCIQADGQGGLWLNYSSTYKALAALTGLGWVERERVGLSKGQQLYSLTVKGRRRLRAEVASLSHAVQLANERLG